LKDASVISDDDFCGHAFRVPTGSNDEMRAVIGYLVKNLGGPAR